MQNTEDRKIRLQNDACSLEVDLFGGAITSFSLKEEVNPLSFQFSEQQMPENNKAGAVFQGHFLCLGRWGPPSEGERQAGMPDHGEAANILWSGASQTERLLLMSASSPMEGLDVMRSIELDASQPVFLVKEEVTNTSVRGRLFNIVQHPTIAAPFLTQDTIVNCNGTQGFDQFADTHPKQGRFNWPVVFDNRGRIIDLRSPDTSYSTVFSFIVDPNATYGWVTAFNPAVNLMIGYVWRREDYPWIHLWQHWDGDTIQYRGLEFGTAGIHRPFREIIKTGVTLFGEKTLAYIDPKERVEKKYISFLMKPADAGNVSAVSLNTSQDQLIIKQGEQKTKINIALNSSL